MDWNSRQDRGSCRPKENLMGDKSPKSVRKQAEQKQKGKNAESQKKQAATDAKQAALKKK